MERTGQVTYHLTEEEYEDIRTKLRAIKEYYIDKDSWYDEDDIKYSMSKLEEIFNL